MTTRGNNAATQPIHAAPLGTRVLQGGGIAFILITVFLISADQPDPGRPKFWMIKPLLVVPLAGAMGGIFYFSMDHLRFQGGWRKTLSILLSAVVYITGLWLGTVLGLNGTMWD